MKLTDVTSRYLIRNSIKRETLVILHWTASSTAESAMNWLKERKDGLGTVGYNYIIGRDGEIFMLADPRVRYFHNTGLGDNYDKNTTSIALVMRDGSDAITDEQITSLRQLLLYLSEIFDIKEVTHHAAVNKNKPDFPVSIFNGLMEETYNKLGS